MKIAITADPMLPVPPENYGGIERIIDFLVRGLIKRGHEVVLVAHRSSTVPVNLIPYRSSESTPYAHFSNLLAVAELKSFAPDVIHSFSRLAYLLPFFQRKVLKLMSYQREPTIGQVIKARRLCRRGSLYFTGCSDYISGKISPYAKAFTVYNGVELGKYDFESTIQKDAPLVFLGRIEPIKGAHIAIEVAKKSGQQLVIAGNVPVEYQSYFDKSIKPHLNGQITYIGPVNDLEKNEWLGKASALLMPIEWDEPFGIVMTEAMACGTPVIGFARGAVKEVVSNAETGFLCFSIEDMVNAVSKISAISRHAVRRDVEVRFSSDVVVENYLTLYQHLLAE